LLPTQSIVIVSNLAAGRLTHSPNRSLCGVFAALAVGFAAVLAWTGWPAPTGVFDFPGLMIAALGASLITLRRPATKIVMQPSFVVDLASLLLLGANAATHHRNGPVQIRLGRGSGNLTERIAGRVRARQCQRRQGSI